MPAVSLSCWSPWVCFHQLQAVNNIRTRIIITENWEGLVYFGRMQDRLTRSFLMSTALSPSLNEPTRRKCPQVSSLALTRAASLPSPLHLTNCVPDFEKRALVGGNGTLSIVASCLFVEGSESGSAARRCPSSHWSLALCIRSTGSRRAPRSASNDL